MGHHVLVIGSGGREHALAWALSRSPQVDQVYVAPGNGGTSWTRGDGTGLQPSAPCKNVPIAANDTAELIAFAQQNAITLTVVGPEDPLANGIVDIFQENGLPVFGPSQAAAQLEASKAFAKAFMDTHNIPTAEYAVFTDIEAARSYVRNVGRPLVVKASGLAAGKGVIICDTVHDAEQALNQIMMEQAFGVAGEQVVIEERLRGREVSVLAFCDGKTAVTMPIARDHKRALDGDRGLNTGGMGAFAPANELSAQELETIERDVLQTVMDGMAAQGTPYVGVLYAGLMLTTEGFKVLEFNCRFGDPETQVILPLLETDFYSVLAACVMGHLEDIELQWRDETCLTVVVASPGYPQSYPKGLPIALHAKLDEMKDVVAFHAGTRRNHEQLVTSGGRVMGITAIADNLNDARQRAYEGVGLVRFDAMHYRQDIGQTASRYAQSGVDIDAGQRAVELMQVAVKATYNERVLSGLGNFGGLFDVSALKDMSHPVLVSSTDGVGTKTIVAATYGRWDGIGRDLVNHCANDILVQGASPLFFLDYIASDQLHPETIAQLVSGMASACIEAGAVLIGGETAEMPGVYAQGAIDVAGTVIGVVERDAIIDGQRIQPGDVLLGLPSSGLHTNGYSLARHALANVDWLAYRDGLGMSIADALLIPHRSYLSPIMALLAEGVDIRGLAHITGGGIIDNVPRILPDGLGAVIEYETWPILPIFKMIQAYGEVGNAEIFRVLNMGIGMIVILPADYLKAAQQILDSPSYAIGRVVDTHADVRIEGV